MYQTLWSSSPQWGIYPKKMTEQVSKDGSVLLIMENWKPKCLDIGDETNYRMLCLSNYIQTWKDVNCPLKNYMRKSNIYVKLWMDEYIDLLRSHCWKECIGNSLVISWWRWLCFHCWGPRFNSYFRFNLTNCLAGQKKKKKYMNIYLIYALTFRKDKCQNISNDFLQGIGKWELKSFSYVSLWPHGL